MRFLKPVAVFVIAVITAQASLNASDDVRAPQPSAKGAPDAAAAYDDTSAPRQNVKTRLVSASTSQPNLSDRGIQQNGFDQYRRQPDLGSGSSPSYGYKHFPLPLNMFGSWYRPRASTLTKAQRCAPDSFRPRGFGHLFARPCDSFRMDYNPYVVKENRTEYGPSYLSRAQDQRCEDCNHCR